MDFQFRIRGNIHRISVERRDSMYTVRHGNSEWTVEFNPSSQNPLTFRVNGKVHRVYMAEAEGRQYVSIMGKQFCVEKHEIRSGLSESSGFGQASTVCPPMPGMVVSVNVREGDIVEKNQSLVVVEAMKMENDLKSPMKGKVKKVHVSPGDLVDAGRPIIELEAI